jgi:hypothetical protein
VDNKLR